MRKPFFIASLCCAILFIGGCTNTSVSSVDKFEVREEKKNLIFQEEFTYNDGESDSSEFHRVEDDKAYISLERISANSTTSFFTNSIGYISLVDGSYHEIASFVDEDLRIWDYVADDNVILASTFNCGFYEVIYKNGDETKQIERNQIDNEFQIPIFKQIGTDIFYLSYATNREDKGVWTALKKIDLKTGEDRVLTEHFASVKDVPDYTLEISEHHLTYGIEENGKNIICDWNADEEKLIQIEVDFPVGKVVWSKGDEYITSDAKRSEAFLLDKNGEKKDRFNHLFNRVTSIGNGVFHTNNKNVVRYNEGVLTNYQYMNGKIKGFVFPKISNIDNQIYVYWADYKEHMIWIDKYILGE